MNWISNAIRKSVPLPMLDAYRKLRYGRTWFDPRGHSVPTVFREIYRRNLWGGAMGQFYSGPGSDPAVADPYINVVSAFINEHGIKSVVDLGCGDFRVGHKLAEIVRITYHGIDVVPELVARNQVEFGSTTISFSCCDITKDRIPDGDVCLIRQVFQHLSNEQIACVLSSCSSFRYLVVTEHVAGPDKLARPNIDICHSMETRVELESGVFLDRPPFNREITRVLCDVSLADGSRIKTVLVEQ